MALHTAKSSYPFLAHPPQKQRPSRPLPPLPFPEASPAQTAHGPFSRSSTFSAIASWAARVHPGSPTSPSPRSPLRRPSLRNGRCPSITSVRGPSTPFLHIVPTPTTAFVPTPSVRDFKADLTTVGYTSVFLQLPNTPISATLPLSITPSSPKAANNVPVPSVFSSTCKPRGLARFRSLSALRSRGRSKSTCPNSPTKTRAKASATSAAIVKRKKLKYAMRPPPLANELALMQFFDGGNMDSNINRIVEAQAKAAGTVGLAGIYRDAEGGVWRDEDEQLEYAHLLAESTESRPHVTGDPHWSTFGSNMLPSTGDVTAEDRRGSVSTQDSDLNPKHVVHPVDSLDRDDLALFSNPVLLTRKLTPFILPRARRAAQHLRKPDSLVDAAFPRPYTSLKGKTRRRPAPLKLSPPSLESNRPTHSPVDTEKVRMDFIAASFEPANSILITPTTPVDVRAQLIENSQAINSPWPSLVARKKSSMLGLFRLAKKQDMMP